MKTWGGLRVVNRYDLKVDLTINYRCQALDSRPNHAVSTTLTVIMAISTAGSGLKEKIFVVSEVYEPP